MSVPVKSVPMKKWGNSAAVRIPAAIMQALDLRANDEVTIREEGGRIVIEPVSRSEDLDALLARITPENLHGEATFGNAVGKEAF